MIGVRYGGSVSKGATARSGRIFLSMIVTASGIGAASAFGFGIPLSSTTAVALSATTGGGNDQRQTVVMTAKPSKVFVAGATGRLGQRVVR